MKFETFHKVNSFKPSHQDKGSIYFEMWVKIEKEACILSRCLRGYRLHLMILRRKHLMKKLYTFSIIIPELLS